MTKKEILYFRTASNILRDSESTDVDVFSINYVQDLVIIIKISNPRGIQSHRPKLHNILLAAGLEVDVQKYAFFYKLKGSIRDFEKLMEVI